MTYTTQSVWKGQITFVLQRDPAHCDEEDDGEGVDDELQEGDAGPGDVVEDDAGHDDAVAHYCAEHQQLGVTGAQCGIVEIKYLMLQLLPTIVWLSKS